MYMIVKVRNEPSEIQILSSLNTRMKLSDSLQQYYVNLQKGYVGEVMFDSLIDELQGNYLVLNDLLFQTNNTTFQIDSMIITSDTIYVFEIKNYQGDFYYESEKIYTKSHTEIVNPLNQLSRTESLLLQLLKSLGFSMSVKSFIVFIHPEFTMYQSPMNKPFIFPTQINRFLKSFERLSSKLTKKHHLLADRLLASHLKDSPFTQVPSYDYDQLKKGIVCEACRSFLVTIQRYYCICSNCSHAEVVSSAILRSLKEYQLLFPDEKITTNRVFDWCNKIFSKKIIRRVLQSNFNSVGVRQWTYYEERNINNIE